MMKELVAGPKTVVGGQVVALFEDHLFQFIRQIGKSFGVLDAGHGVHAEF